MVVVVEEVEVMVVVKVMVERVIVEVMEVLEPHRFLMLLPSYPWCEVEERPGGGDHRHLHLLPVLPHRHLGHPLVDSERHLLAPLLPLQGPHRHYTLLL